MDLKEKIKTLPTGSGVYHFVDESGGILYVGKAKNLKKRVSQYFLKNLNRGPAIEQMIRLAVDVKWTETDSEIEAVLLEADQINLLKPKYNIRQKDDKSFLVIKITRKISNSFIISSEVEKYPVRKDLSPRSVHLDDGLTTGRDDSASKQINHLTAQRFNQFPCVELVRFRNIDLSDKSADFFGPYPKGESLKKSLRYLRRIFPYRDCSVAKWRTYAKKGRPCLYGDIGLCPAPCIGKIDMKKYDSQISYFKKFLLGKKGDVISDLKKEMAILSKNKEFERAVEIRNKIYALDHINEAKIGLKDGGFGVDSGLFERIECYDISNLLANEAVGSMIVFTNGKPDKDEYKKFKVKSSKLKVRSSEELPSSDLERLEQVLDRRFKNDWPLPNLIVIDGGATHLKIAKKVIAEYHLNIPAISISKGPRRDKNDFHFLDQPTAQYFKKNPDLQKIAIMARDEAHRFAIKFQRELHRKNIYK